MADGDSERRVQTTCLMILAAVALAVALYWLRSVMVPFVLAAFAAVSLAPLLDLQVRHLRLPRMVALFSTGLLGVILLCSLGLLVAASIGQLEKNSDRYRQRLEELTQKGTELLAVLPLEKLDIDQGEALSRLRKASADMAGNALVTTTSTIVNIFSQGTLVVLFLCFLIAGGVGQAGAARGLWADVESRIKSYLITKVLLSAATGLLVGLILFTLGVDLWLIFGLFAFLLNFIPTLGSIIATLLPRPMVLLNPDISALAGVLAIVLPATVQTVIGNILEPKMMGKSLQLHPIAILMALIVWGMLWGIIGMLLAVPMTAIVKILLERSEVTAPAARLLEGKLNSAA